MYSWDKDQCDQFWKDILKIGLDDKACPHFISSIVYIKDDVYHHSSVKKLLIIDGQQRLITLTLLLIALRNITDNSINKDDCSEISHQSIHTNKIR
ncbi:DUF262 domain-containing protein [Campylobacter jejuni]|nr:DUF262 domain-containing protein [Campylobacter jejuni]HDZ4932062.1 DUF262 domain-containing protein [Campylobacter jejuni]HDZ4936836.1 DUF262 domain-containing protein [Campylobacter jejuni]HDZ4940289.1 DUF262 domain-containing protein [Campylobacter jejuni]HDZ4943155.1 DUF262 domain-containing protein [Campylobacter jejuni]